VTRSAPNAGPSIWSFALGYFLSYVPYAAMTKAITAATPVLPRVDAPIGGLSLLPLSVAASVVGMFTFITAMGWWKYAGRRQILSRVLPCPSRWTFFSGLCTALIIGTTTLAYTFQGVSIVFMMLLMRGGLLIIAPIVDAVSRRHVRWFSWIAVLLSMAALFAAFASDVQWVDGRPTLPNGFGLPALAAIDVAIYLGAYFARLRFMSRVAKSDDGHARIRYFVEEQMVASPALLLSLAAVAVVGGNATGGALRAGFAVGVGMPLVYVLLIGLFSQGTGIFGGLILLVRRENTFCVPVNRSSSILAGVVATTSLWLLAGGAAPGTHELVGAALIIAAILVLTLAPLGDRRRRARG